MKKCISVFKFLFLLSATILFTSCKPENCKSVPLTESWQYATGNNKLLADPSTDTTGWKKVSNLEDIIFEGKHNYFCLRSEVSIPEDFKDSEVYIGFKKMNAAFDVYADGIYIGSRGRMPPKENIKIQEENEVLIPSQFIHNGKVNIALICYSPENQIIDPEFTLDNFEEAYFINTVKKICNQTLFVMMGIASIFFIFYSLLQYLIDSHDVSYLYFIISVIFISLYFVDLGGTIQVFDFNFQHPLFRSFLAVGMCFMYLFLNRFYNKKGYKLMMALMFSLSALLIIIFLANSGKSANIESLFMVGLAVVVSCVVYSYFCTVSAIKHGQKDSIPIFIGFTAATFIALHDIVYQIAGKIPFMWIQGIAFFVLDLSIFVTLAIRQLHSKRNAEQMAQDFKQKKEMLSNIIDNAQKLANESNQIANELNMSVDSVVNASEQTQLKIKDINLAIQEQTTIRNETDKAIHNLTDFLVNISKEFDNETQIITNTVSQTQDVIKGIYQVGEGITTAVSFTTSLNNLIQASNEDTKQLMKISEAIQESSKEILGVVTTLDTFAGQIDLLSMNASIEAAHSGVAGKGFSVIAHEIKNLASQVQQWSARIGEIITSITDSIDQSVGLTGKVNNALKMISEGSVQSAEKVNAAANGIKIQEEAGKSISEESQILFDSANKMQVEVQNQSAFSEQVLGNMDSLSKASHSVDDASDAIEQVSARLGDEAQKLRAMAKRTTEAAERLLKIME